ELKTQMMRLAGVTGAGEVDIDIAAIAVSRELQRADGVQGAALVLRIAFIARHLRDHRAPAGLRRIRRAVQQREITLPHLVAQRAVALLDRALLQATRTFVIGLVSRRVE